MFRTLLAASAATLSLALSPAMAPDDIIPVKSVYPEAVVTEAHTVMNSMMDLFLDAFVRAGIQEKQLKETLMARIDMSVVEFIAERTEKAHLESLMAYLSPDAQDSAHDFFESGEGQELAAALVRAGAPVPQNPFTDEEHHELIAAIIEGIDEEAEAGTISTRKARRLARAIHHLDS